MIVYKRNSRLLKNKIKRLIHSSRKTRIIFKYDKLKNIEKWEKVDKWDERDNWDEIDELDIIDKWEGV